MMYIVGTVPGLLLLLRVVHVHVCGQENGAGDDLGMKLLKNS